jgi:MFS family permease
MVGESLKAANVVLILAGTQPGHTSFWLPLAGQIIGGCGFSIAISTDSGLLRTITESGGNALFGKVQARSQTLMLVATLVSGVSGALLYANSSDWVFLASLAANVVAILLMFAIRTDDQPHPVAPAAQNGAAPPAKWKLDPVRRSWVMFYALSRAFTLAPFVAFMPYFFISIGTDQVLFGAVLSLFTVFGIISAQNAGKFLQRYGVRVLGLATVACMVGAMALYGFSPVFAENGIDYFIVGLAGMALFGLGSGGIRPVALQNLELGGVPAPQRPGVLSRMEREYGIWNMGLMLVGGYLMSVLGFIGMMQWLVVGYLGAVGFLAISFTRGSAAPAAQEKPA